MCFSFAIYGRGGHLGLVTWTIYSNFTQAKSGICLLIAPVPVHCFSLTFISRVLVVVQCGGRKKSPRTSI